MATAMHALHRTYLRLSRKLPSGVRHSRRRLRMHPLPESRLQMPRRKSSLSTDHHPQTMSCLTPNPTQTPQVPKHMIELSRDMFALRKLLFTSLNGTTRAYAIISLTARAKSFRKAIVKAEKRVGGKDSDGDNIDYDDENWSYGSDSSSSSSSSEDGGKEEGEGDGDADNASDKDDSSHTLGKDDVDIDSVELDEIAKGLGKNMKSLAEDYREMAGSIRELREAMIALKDAKDRKKQRTEKKTAAVAAGRAKRIEEMEKSGM
jgi:hypothetical protein